MDRFTKQIEFIKTVDEMKAVLRRSLTISTRQRENDAEHSWHIALMAVLLSEYASPEVDVNYAVKMCLVHDLVEIYAGDTFCWDKVGNLSKDQREKEASEKLFALLPADQGEDIKNTWLEFDERKTPTSLFANVMDRLQPFILNVENEGHTWRLAHATLSQIMERFSFIKEVLPKAWEYIDSNLKTAIEKGWIIDDLK